MSDDRVLGTEDVPWPKPGGGQFFLNENQWVVTISMMDTPTSHTRTVEAESMKEAWEKASDIAEELGWEHYSINVYRAKDAPRKDPS